MNSFLIHLPADVLPRGHAHTQHSPSGEPRERRAALGLAALTLLAGIVAAVL